MLLEGFASGDEVSLELLEGADDELGYSGTRKESREVENETISKSGVEQ